MPTSWPSSAPASRPGRISWRSTTPARSAEIRVAGRDPEPDRAVRRRASPGRLARRCGPAGQRAGSGSRRGDHRDGDQFRRAGSRAGLDRARRSHQCGRRVPAASCASSTPLRSRRACCSPTAGTRCSPSRVTTVLAAADGAVGAGSGPCRARGAACRHRDRTGERARRSPSSNRSAWRSRTWPRLRRVYDAGGEGQATAAGSTSGALCGATERHFFIASGGTARFRCVRVDSSAPRSRSPVMAISTSPRFLAAAIGVAVRGAPRRAPSPRHQTSGSGSPGTPAADAATLTASQSAGRITVTGTGTVTGTPNQLVLSMGVQVNGVTRDLRAGPGQPGIVREVTAAFRQRGVARSDIQTSGLNISPNYQGNSGIASQLRRHRVADRDAEQAKASPGSQIRPQCTRAGTLSPSTTSSLNLTEHRAAAGRSHGRRAVTDAQDQGDAVRPCTRRAARPGDQRHAGRAARHAGADPVSTRKPAPRALNPPCRSRRYPAAVASRSPWSSRPDQRLACRLTRTAWRPAMLPACAPSCSAAGWWRRP